MLVFPHKVENVIVWINNGKDRYCTTEMSKQVTIGLMCSLACC